MGLVIVRHVKVGHHDLAVATMQEAGVTAEQLARFAPVGVAPVVAAAIVLVALVQHV
jgi:hypothetical protein